MKNTIVVNLFAGPGAGKSTGAAYVFSNLKMNGIDAEYVSEYAKDKVWEKNDEVFKCQFYVTGKQTFKIARVYGKVDVIITDSPIAIGAQYTDEEPLKNAILYEFKKYNNFNVFIDRVKKYNPNGRHQTEDEAKKIDETTKEWLDDNQIDYISIKGNLEGYEQLSDMIKNKLKESNTEYSTIPEMVDLGLPSGLKWARWNVGATNETEYGKYFAWGDVTGATSEGCSGKFSTSWYAAQGLTAITSDLTLAQDAANVAYGGDYRMPTSAEMEELTANTTYSQATINGVLGGKFTASSNGNYVFFPFAGFGYKGSLNVQGNGVSVWSSSYNDDSNAWGLDCFNKNYGVYYYVRYCGFSVRAVCE